jgi:hypothetical protein
MTVLPAVALTMLVLESETSEVLSRVARASRQEKVNDVMLHDDRRIVPNEKLPPSARSRRVPIQLGR